MAFDYRREYRRYRQYYVNLNRVYQRPMVKVSFFVLLSFFAVVFFSVFAIQPTVTTVSELVREIEDKQRIDDVLGEKIVALDELQGVMLTIQNDIPLILNALPQNSALGRLMQEFEYVAQQAGVALLSVRFQPVGLSEDEGSRGEKAQMVDFSLSVGGSFANLSQFLDTLEKLDRLLVLQKVEFISGASFLRQQGLEAIVEVTGQAFFLKETLGEEQDGTI